MDIKESKSYNALNIALFGDYKKLEKLFNEYGAWTTAWENTKTKTEIDAEKEWEKLNEHNIKLILVKDENFPTLLKEIPFCPFGLYIKGVNLRNEDLTIAIVGTRKSSAHGKITAKNFAHSLGKANFTIISGLALGIDTAAHLGALEARARTIAVLANGLNDIYPRQNYSVAQKILKNRGTLVSEYAVNSPSLPHRFIERNRIISGLALGSIIIEAPQRSGAMATARFAIEQNREVFVVPGNFDNKNFEGSHELIKAGAALITSPEDVLKNLGLEETIEKTLQEKKILEIRKLDEKQKSVILCLQDSGEKLELDEISKSSGLEIPETGSIASLLVIQGFIKEENGKYFI